MLRFTTKGLEPNELLRTCARVHHHSAVASTNVERSPRAQGWREQVPWLRCCRLRDLGVYESAMGYKGAQLLVFPGELASYGGAAYPDQRRMLTRSWYLS